MLRIQLLYDLVLHCAVSVMSVCYGCVPVLLFDGFVAPINVLERMRVCMRGRDQMWCLG